MSTSAIAASSTNFVSSVVGVERPLIRQPSGDGDSNSGSAPVQGGRLFTALFDALTQFVAEHQSRSGGDHGRGRFRGNITGRNGKHGYKLTHPDLNQPDLNQLGLNRLDDELLRLEQHASEFARVRFTGIFT